MGKSHSRFGIASFILALLTWLGFVAVGIVAILMGDSYSDDSFGAMFLGLGILVVCLIGILAVLLGIASLLQSDRKKTFGVLGLILSVVAVVLLVAMSFLGKWADESSPAGTTPIQPAS